MTPTESVQILGQLLRHAQVAITIADAEGVLTEFNHAAEKLTGFSRDEVIGKPVSQFYANDHAATLLFEKLFEDGKLEGERITLMTRNGPVPASITVAMLRSAEGEVIGSVGITLSLAEHDRLERALMQARQIAEFCNDLMVHDIRNYAQTIGGYLESLLGGRLGGLSEGQLRVLQICNRQVQRVQALFEQNRALLGLMAAEASPGTVPRRLQPRAVEPALQSAVAAVERLYPERSIQVAITIPSSATVRVCPLFSTLLFNLVLQAVEHDPSDSQRIRIGVESGREAGRPVYRIAVQDSGPPRDSETMQSLLRLNPDLKWQSTDLRLPVVALLVERCGGRIWTEPVTGEVRGTRVVVELTSGDQPEEERS
jgi:PAS domain S-box-containing protein